MRWLRRGPGKESAQFDPDQLGMLLHEVRHRFGAQVPVRFSDQAQAVARLLTGDEGLVVAAGIVREFADAAHADIVGRVGHTGSPVPVDRRNYRPLWHAVGPQLRWSAAAPQHGLYPYVQVAGAVTVVGTQSQRIVRVTDPYPLLAGLFEVLDLIVAGWHFGRARVDADAATLAAALIEAARSLRDAMSDPPPLPPPVRAVMRTNRSIEVLDPGVDRVVGSFNPGKRMREALLA